MFGNAIYHDIEHAQYCYRGHNTENNYLLQIISNFKNTFPINWSNAHILRGG